MSQRTTKKHREWTRFEKHTLLCLMAKGAHLEQRGKKNDDPNKARQNAYFDVATELNEAVHKDDYRNDLDKRDVARMIDRVLLERKAVVGKGGVMERQVVPHVTRTLRRMWERPSKFDYDGTIGEWNNGRKEREVEKLRIANGGALRGDTQAPVEVNDDEIALATVGNTSRPRGDYWNQADIAASSATRKTKWRSTQRAPPVATPLHVQSYNQARSPSYQPARRHLTADTGYVSLQREPYIPRALPGSEKSQLAAAGLPARPPGAPGTSYRIPAKPAGCHDQDNGDDSSLARVSSLVGDSDPSHIQFREVPPSRPSSHTQLSDEILSYGLPSSRPASTSIRPNGQFADMRIYLPPKPPSTQSSRSKEIAPPSVSQSTSTSCSYATARSEIGPNASALEFMRLTESPTKSTSSRSNTLPPAGRLEDFNLNTSMNHDDHSAKRLGSEMLHKHMHTQDEKTAAGSYTAAGISSLIADYAGNRTLPDTTNTKRGRQLSNKTSTFLQENIDPARLAMMKMEETRRETDEDFEAQILRPALSITTANTEELPFNRLENARDCGIEHDDPAVEVTDGDDY